jgi:uncharacterized protein
LVFPVYTVNLKEHAMKINKKFFVNLLLTGILCLPYLNLYAQPTAEDIYQKALAADAKGRFFEAMNLSREAAEKGNPGAQSFYGYLLDKADNDKEAEDWYRKAVAQNNLQGIMHLARLLGESKNQKDAAEALRLYHQAEQMGSVLAIQIIAQAYQFGRLTLTQNDQLAVKWLLKTADKNIHSANVTLAKAYENGELGLKMNYKKALQFYLKAAELDSSIAIIRLQRIYQNGELGEKKNPDQAKVWQTRLIEIRNPKGNKKNDKIK